MISNAEIDNMAKATQMSDAQLVAMLRTISTVYDDETLAKWILAVAAERLEKRTQARQLRALALGTRLGRIESSKLTKTK